MLKAMTCATFGDSVYQEDETTNNFEAKIAKLAGKEAGLFCVSGTMSNQLAIRTHLGTPPHSVLCDYRAHIYTAEAAGLAVLSQAMVTPVRPRNGVYLTVQDIQENVLLGDDIHQAPTKVISLENTLGGTLMPVDEIEKIYNFAKANGLKMHMDGARLWNASIATGISIDEYAKYFDTVSLCLSKGLGAPIGSILVGTKKNIVQANWLKKQAGGGIRQSGLLTSAANVAVEEIWPTMAITHAKTAKLAKDLEALGIHPQIPVQTNFIFMDAERAGLDMDIFKQEAAKHNVKVLGERLVLHHQTADSAIESLLAAISSALQLSKKSIQDKSKTPAVSVYSRQRMNGNLDRVL